MLASNYDKVNLQVNNEVSFTSLLHEINAKLKEENILSKKPTPSNDHKNSAFKVHNYES